MKKNYDVLVIGAGLGGLCAAFECLRAGKKTLLLEQHNLPGGYASSFTRGRFEFEPALHEMPDMRSIKEATGVVRYLLDDAGLDIDFLSIPDAYRVILTENNTDQRIPFGIEAFIQIIEDKVPGSRPSVEKYMDLCVEVQEAFGYLNNNADDINYKQLLKKYDNFIRTGAATAAQVADSLKVPKEALDLLYPYWCYLGVPANRVSFSIWAALLNSYISSGAVIPKLRSHEIALAFIDKIEDLGGDVRFNTKVNRILSQDQKITGVQLETGEVISCNQVICNTSPTNVFNQMIFPKTEVPKTAYRNIGSRKYGFSLMVVYLGLNASKEEIGLEDYSYFIAPHMDTEKLYQGIYDIETDQIMQASVCLNVANPTCSPEGTCILSITAGFRAEAWENIPEADYFKTKDRVARRLIEQFEVATKTSILGHIEEIEIAAPETFARYTGAYNGIVYGYEPEPWDGIIPRALSQNEENYLFGLHFCGGFSYRCHGYGSSLLSGKTAAENSCKQSEDQE